ncbi:MAG TPA: sulfur carrier protein ThiS [Phycisphaerae bacterium]|nr:sulfur carrier protein ThiS [Phycisphaerae bacterium]
METATLTISVNGERQGLTVPASVAALVELRGPRPPFAVEVNKRLVRRGDYAATELHEGDVVEIVTLVGGG